MAKTKEQIELYKWSLIVRSLLCIINILMFHTKIRSDKYTDKLIEELQNEYVIAESMKVDISDGSKDT